MIDLGSNPRLIDEMPGNGGGTATLPLPRREPLLLLSTAELAECTCPDFCERDHDTD